MCVVKCFFDTTKYKVELEFGSLRSWRYCQGAAVHGNNRTGCGNSPGWLPGRLWAGGCTVKASISWLLGEAFRMTNGMRRGWNIHTHTSFKFTSCVLPSLPVSLPWLGPPVPSPCTAVHWELFIFSGPHTYCVVAVHTGLDWSGWGLNISSNSDLWKQQYIWVEG